MATTQNGPFSVSAGDVSTGVNVLAGDTVQTIATGVVSFARVIGRTFSADGDDWATPDDFPAPSLRKHSLLVRFGGGPWHQGGTTAVIPVPVGESGEITLRTNDHDDWLWDNDLEWSVTIVHTRPDPPPPAPGTTPALSIAAVEFVQSIQSWNNAVPLIMGKRTLVRVYVDSGVRSGFDAGWGANRWGGVTGTISLVDPRDGSSVETLSPTLGAASILARPVAEMDRENLSHSLAFELPPAAISLPSLRADITVSIPSSPWRATHTTTRTFVARTRQPILPILINLETNGVGPPSAAQFDAALLERTLPRFPVAEDGFLVHPPFGWTTRNDLTIADHWGLLLSQMATVALISSTRVDGIRCGVVNDTPGGWRYGGMASPRIWGSRLPTLIANVERLTTFAHELAHAFGVWHANCKGTEEQLDNRKIPGVTDEVGFDMAAQAVVPRGTDELQGYCSQERWPSVRTYGILANEGVI
jgi:hypothetical protein